MPVTFAIDWLHITDPYNEAIPLRLHIHPLLSNRGYTETIPHYGYLEAVRNTAGALAMSNPLRQDMGVHVSYSASALNSYQQHGFDALTILRWHIGKCASVSRIDLAFDLRDTTLNIAQLFALLETRRASTTARQWNLITGHDGGATLYIGSRSSEAMIRVYDKAVEQSEKGNWKRVEIELKGDKANTVACQLANEKHVDTVEHARRLINGMCYFPDWAWIEAFGYSSIAIAPANKKESDTLHWLLNVAAPTLGKHMARTGDQSLLARFLRIVRINRSKTK